MQLETKLSYSNFFIWIAGLQAVVWSKAGLARHRPTQMFAVCPITQDQYTLIVQSNNHTVKSLAKIATISWARVIHFLITNKHHTTF